MRSAHHFTVRLILLACCWGLNYHARAAVDAPSTKETEAPTPVATRTTMLALGEGYIVDLASEFLRASDVFLLENSYGFRMVRNAGEISVVGLTGMMEADYRPAGAPFDVLSEPASLRESGIGGQASVRYRLSPELTLSLVGGAYEGHSDFRSLWLDEYFRQYFQPVPGYRTAEPAGWNVAAGLLWEYWPATGSAQIDALYSRDEIAPGYSIVDFELRRGTGRLYNTGLRLRLENVFLPRLRMLHEFYLVDSTDRRERYSWQGSLNWALASNWVARATVAASKEELQFSSQSYGLTLEYDIQDKWYFSVGGRYYRDTGQIENAESITPATPPLDTYQVTAGVRWEGKRLGMKVVAGPYWTRHAPLAIGVQPFAPLYADRDWLFFQASLQYKF